MTKQQHLFIAVCSPLLLIFAAAALLPAAPVARAQTPCENPIVTNTFHIFPDLPTVDGWTESDADVPADAEMWDLDLGIYGPWIKSNFSIYDDYYLQFDGGPGSHYAVVKLSAADFLADIGESGTTFPSENLNNIRWYNSESTADAGYSHFAVEYTDGSITQYNSQTSGGYTYVEHTVTEKFIENFYIWAAYVQEGGYIYISEVSLYYDGCQDSEGFTCPTVQDYHFTGVPTDTWALGGSAAIVSSTLTIGGDDSAGQNLITGTITSSPYNAVISITNVTAPTELLVWLHNVTQSVTITQPGLYTATLNVITGSAGTAAYLLNNLSETTLDVDWTCIYTGTRSSSCIAPLNGTFEDDNNWQWVRNAEWKEDQQNAFLPYDTLGLIQYTQPLSLPAIYEGEKLLMSFTARSACSDGDGLIGSRVQITNTEPITVDYLFDTYLTPRLYEEDLSFFAGRDNIILQFANPGLQGCMGYTSTDSVYLDDICIFIADRNPNLPITTTMSGAGYVDPYCTLGGLGGFSSCDDVDEILASLGVDMAYYRAAYEAGASVWEPSGWVPWLIAAMWVQLAALICFLMFMLLELIHFFTWLLNSILNYLAWFRSYWTGFFTWLGVRLGWLLASLGTFFTWVGATIAAFWPWLFETLFTLNGLRLVVNFLISAWNVFLQTTGQVIGWLIDTLFVTPWNNGIVPLGNAIYNHVSTTGTLKLLLDMLLSFLGAMWGAISTLFWFIWRNIVGLVLLPVDFYRAFVAGINESAFDTPFTCSSENFWCLFLAGVQLINQTASQSIIYPLFIIGIILTTLVVLWVNIKALFSVNIK